MQIDNKESFIPENPRIAIVSVVSSQIAGHREMAETNHSLTELKLLLDTLDLSSEKEYIQVIKRIDPAYVIGEGKIEEIKSDGEQLGFNLLVFDIELTAAQHRNIQQSTGLMVIDRNMIILEIFAKHATSKDAKMQVEIAKLEYLLPRLHSVWYRQDRVRGGAAGMRGGKGESAKELEKRLIKDRIAYYKKESEAIENHLIQQRKKREENAYITALVGYTNAGKSSLMNKLCNESLYVENKLFATVDATYRCLSVSFKPTLLLIDTVGFISNLPTQLVKGFRSTLASVLESHNLLIVSDISDINCREQLEVTLSVLDELKALDRPRLYIFNKKDRIDKNPNAASILENYPEHLLVSSFDESDMDKIKNSLTETFQAMQQNLKLFIPYSDGMAHSKIMEVANIKSSENQGEGILYHVSVAKSYCHLELFKKYVCNASFKFGLE